MKACKATTRLGPMAELTKAPIDLRISFVMLQIAPIRIVFDDLR